MSTSAPTITAARDYDQELTELIERLSVQPDREAIAAELGALQSIYGEGILRVWIPHEKGSRPPSPANANTTPGLRFEVTLSLLPPHEDISVHILISLPHTYPATSPPQLQLLSRYIGAFGADSNIFGNVLRVYMSVNGVEWTPDAICVFDGLQRVLELCTEWYTERLSMGVASQIVREDGKDATRPYSAESSIDVVETPDEHITEPIPTAPTVAIPEGIQIFEAEPITDRKSAFVGRACRISHPSQVPLILSHLVSDRRISRAAHPIINAWRCHVGSILHQDNDDDGETAAGGRLAHLLQILDVDNVLIVVTRYFGGIHLGPDRFKHINQAARNALEIGGFLDGPGPDSRVEGKRAAAQNRAKRR